MLYKAHSTVQRKVAPTDADLDLIHQYALAGETLDADSLFIGRKSLCNDQLDRSHERFPEGYLLRFAETMPGKSVMTGHNYTLAPEGRYFKAEISTGLAASGVMQRELVMSYYLLADSDLARKVKAGIARDVSIGFNPDTRICDLCEKDYDGWMQGADDACGHIAGREHEGKLCTLTYGGDLQKVEGLEGSFVWLGCQYGAQAIASMRAFSPQAKAAYFESRAGKGVWHIPFHEEVDLFRISGPRTGPAHTAAKELSMPQEEKGAAPTGELKLSAEQEALIACGQAFRKFAAAHVKSRYDACGFEEMGEMAAESLEAASGEKLLAAIEKADATFNKHFPGTGKGVPMSDTQGDQPRPPRPFNPLARNGRY